MAHLRVLEERWCRACSRRARYVLLNRQNAELGAYCVECGEKQLKKQMMLEEFSDAQK